MSGLAGQEREVGRADWLAAPAAPAAPASSVRLLFNRVLPGMVARGHGLETLCLYLAIARAALLDLVVALGLPTPHDRPHRRAGGRNPWSPADIVVFIELWVEGWRAGSLADRFGRSPGAIWSKARQLGLPKRDRRSLVRPTNPHALPPSRSAHQPSVSNFPLAARACDAAALPAQPGDHGPGPATLVPPSAGIVATPAAPGVSGSGVAGLAIPFLPVSKQPASDTAIPSADAASGRAPAVQAVLPDVLSRPDVRGPARTGRRARGLAPVQAQAAPQPVPLLVPRLVAELASANPNASAAVKTVRKHFLRAASDPLAAPAINRRIRPDGRVECDWVPAADLDVAYRHLGGQHDIYAAAALGLSVSCIRTRKWLTEVPHQIRGQTVEEFNPAWAEDTIDAWGLRLQQCHAYRDIKGVEFWFWARNGDGRIFSKRAKSKLWFRERASSGDYAW